MKKSTALTAAFLAALWIPASGHSLESPLQRAALAWDRGDYPAALTAYLQVLDSPAAAGPPPPRRRQRARDDRAADGRALSHDRAHRERGCAAILSRRQPPCVRDRAGPEAAGAGGSVGSGGARGRMGREG